MSEKKDKDLIKFEGNSYKKQAFLIEDKHPAIGRILNVDGIKFKILDNAMVGSSRSGTFIKKITKEDEKLMLEYDEAIETLSEKLVSKVDIKRLIKENIKNKSLQEIKTGLFILKAEEEGKIIQEEHHKGCYHFKMYFENQCFDFATGNDEEEFNI